MPVFKRERLYFLCPLKINNLWSWRLIILSQRYNLIVLYSVFWRSTSTFASSNLLKDLPIQQFKRQFVVKRFNLSVLPGSSRLNVKRLHAADFKLLSTPSLSNPLRINLFKLFLCQAKPISVARLHLKYWPSLRNQVNRQTHAL